MSAWDLRTLVPEKPDIWLISGYFTKLFERLDGPDFSTAIKMYLLISFNLKWTVLWNVNNWLFQYQSMNSLGDLNTYV